MRETTAHAAHHETISQLLGDAIEVLQEPHEVVGLDIVRDGGRQHIDHECLALLRQAHRFEDENPDRPTEKESQHVRHPTAGNEQIGNVIAFQ